MEYFLAHIHIFGSGRTPSKHFYKLIKAESLEKSKVKLKNYLDIHYQGKSNAFIVEQALN